jgi:hypothetical protein
MPRRYNTNNNRPSFARLTSHLYRLYDYDSCVEAQLKIWLATHLLRKNNPRKSVRGALIVRETFTSCFVQLTSGV